MLYVGWMDGMGWDGIGLDAMVIIGRRYSQSTFRANQASLSTLARPADDDDDDDDDNDDVDDDDDDDDEREDKEEEDYLIRCKMGPQACIMVWPDGYQGVSSYDYA